MAQLNQKQKKMFTAKVRNVSNAYLIKNEVNLRIKMVACSRKPVPARERYEATHKTKRDAQTSTSTRRRMKGFEAR
eukprot:CAMPEP_0194326486 /NCGR_PEP_ID=MMETSP0171-20130528/36599_1 /TAXON_ID=218684 /ORGANISM="Corethron pennatum, Strain L29A3" /LENGTH=75 /DNA_ID=CAMNT_0039086073 /DNA_START=262 /DNA_END=486 /DNA_ORIENTATION=+